MFDISNSDTRDQKSKFIEILLVVGGIIGGLRLQDKNDPMNIVLGLFLLGSLLYYFAISNPKIYSRALSKSVSIGLIVAISLVSFGFSAIAVLTFIFQGITPLHGAFVLALWLALSILIFLNLYS